ncbi:MAG: hypothetical protein KIS66_14520 [Fimbriimonadaceae bacterium]|nr:hypothetical protein [Fimbriimonadaceae bacterium]
MSASRPRVPMAVLSGVVGAHTIVNAVVPAVFRGSGSPAPALGPMGPILANAAALTVFAAVVALALGWLEEHPAGSLSVTVLAVMAVGLPLFGFAEAAPATSLLAVIALVVVVGTGVRRALPLRAYNALGWFGLVFLLVQLDALRGRFGIPDMSGWLPAVAQGATLVAWFVAFASWCLPLRGLRATTVLTSLGLTIAGIVALSVGGRRVASIAMESFGLALVGPLWVYALVGFLASTLVLSSLASGASTRGWALLLFALVGGGYGDSTAVLASVLTIAAIVSDYPLRERNLAAEWRDALANWIAHGRLAEDAQSASG